MEREVWSSFTRDPRDRQFRGLRASDQDRSLVQQVLTDAYADGRLDRAEFDERSEAARTVRVLGDIDPLLRDLVAPRSQPVDGSSLAQAGQQDLEQLAQRYWERKRRDAVFSFLGASLFTSAIWVATSFHSGSFEPYFFWPAFVIALSLLNLVRTAASRREIVDDHLRRLQRRQAKELRGRQPRGPLDWRW